METEKTNSCTEVEENAKTLPHVSDSASFNADATSNGRPALEGDAERSWEDRLTTLKQRITDLQENYKRSYLEIGRVLIQARDIYKGHGDWIKWLKENVPFSVRHAQRLIRVAEMFDDATLVSRLGLTSSKAYVLTRVGKDDISHFSTSLFYVGDGRKFVKAMTKRELEFVVTNFLKEKLTQRDHEGSTFNQGDEPLITSVKSDFGNLRKALDKVITSIKGIDSDNRKSWISELEELCKTGLEQLESESE